MRILVLMMCLIGLASCFSSGSDGVGRQALTTDPRVEICSAGSSVKISAEANADLSELLQKSGGVDVSVEREVETMLSQAAGGALTEENLLKAQENYMACLKSEAELVSRNAKPWQNYSATQCLAFSKCEDSRMSKLTICREEMERAGQATRACYDGLSQKLMGCYEVETGDQLELARSFCDANHSL